MTTSNWREDFYERFPNIWMEGPKGTYTTIDQWVLAFIEKELEAAKQEERDAIVEVVERMGEQNEITQAILGALEYRGFSDLGKYLDGDIWEGVKPIIITHLQTSNKNN